MMSTMCSKHVESYK